MFKETLMKKLPRFLTPVVVYVLAAGMSFFLAAPPPGKIPFVAYLVALVIGFVCVTSSVIGSFKRYATTVAMHVVRTFYWRFSHKDTIPEHISFEEDLKISPNHDSYSYEERNVIFWVRPEKFWPLLKLASQLSQVSQETRDVFGALVKDAYEERHESETDVFKLLHNAEKVLVVS